MTDLAITDPLFILENVSYLMRGNLTVKNGGALTLINSTLVFDSNENVTYGIYVEAGGALTIKDHDNDPATAGDASRIRSNRIRSRLLPPRGVTTPWSLAEAARSPPYSMNTNSPRVNCAICRNTRLPASSRPLAATEWMRRPLATAARSESP